MMDMCANWYACSALFSSSLLTAGALLPHQGTNKGYNLWATGGKHGGRVVRQEGREGVV